MRNTIALTPCLSLCLVLGATGCLPNGVADSGPLTETFAVSDYYSPSGFMGDGANFRHLYADIGQNCAPRPPNAQGQCFTFTYYVDTSPTAFKWAGVFWVFPGNNWGTRPGHAIDTTKFHSIHFSMAVDYPPEPPDVVAMGISPEQPKATYGIQNNGFANADAISGSLFPTVGSTMKEFWIPFPDINPVTTNDSLIGAFGWAIAFPGYADPNIPLVVHVDDIVWDTAPPPAPATVTQ
jgi:hypothetical protein